MSTSNPPPRISTQDASGHEVSESSDDHFSSASEGDRNNASSDAASDASPIPLTRVERVDDEPRHGEVPGTPAYAKRLQDAVPDEIEVVPEGLRSRSGTLSRSRANSAVSLGGGAGAGGGAGGVEEGGSIGRPQTPGGSPIPKTVVEKVDAEPSYGEVDGTLAKEKRMADAAPDEVKVTPDGAAAASIQGRSGDVAEDPADRQAWFRSMWEKRAEEEEDEGEEGEETGEESTRREEDGSNDADADDDFGDDFDDFEEGGNNDDDFGDFDEADTTPVPQPEPETSHPPTQSAVPSMLAGLPPLDLKLDLSTSELQDTITPYLDAIFPDSASAPSELAPVDMSNSSPFLSDRSLSLWQQLVSPPPMQPPNWTRSRIRRLFLVSLGVPVDLDEILPPSKQKRLILPNINLGSPRASSGALERLRQTSTNDSSTSVDSKTGAPKKSKRSAAAPGARGPPPPPEFDANAAALVSGTTEEAMARFSDAELAEHVAALEALNRRASSVLEYWLQRKDESLKEKEALEGVIENLVGFVKGRRGK